MAGTLYAALIAVSGAALVARAFLREGDRAAWGLLGAGLLLWAAGDAFWLIWPDTTAYPSVADALYFGYYAAAVAALVRLARRPRGSGFAPWALVSAALGLATLWSWLVFGPILEDAVGTPGAFATTLAYPLCDLLLLTGALVVIVSQGWRLRGGTIALVAGLCVVAIADGIWTVEVAADQLVTSAWLDPLWPIGAILVALAGWLPYPKRVEAANDELVDNGLARGFAIASMAIALAALVRDHFVALSLLTVLLATLTVIAAFVQIVLLYRRQAATEAERAELEALLAASADASLDAIITSDGFGVVRAWNRAAERIFGYSREAAIGRSVEELIVPPTLRPAHREMKSRLTSIGASRTIGNRVETVGMRSNGSQLPIELTIARVTAPRLMFTAFVRDITDRKRRDEERERFAAMVSSTDEAMYSMTLDGVVIAWNPAATALYGYSPEEAVGERMLDPLVPPELRAEAREGLARVGRGEPFSWDTRRVHKDGYYLDVSNRYFPIRDEVGRVRGCTVVTRDVTDRRRRELEEQQHRERAAWRSQVEDALDFDAFEFFAQPIVSVEDGSISHHELLLRLRLDGEIVPPGKFLPHVEETPLMRRIDRWAMRKGIELAGRGRVAINLSATSLGDAGVIGAVERALADHGVDPGNVIFEITETAAAENLDDATALVAALRALGCGVALDDFGTGYGSFTYLKRLDVTELKIDMEFIAGLSSNPADQRVVRSMVAVASNFEIQTVAEGVEDEQTFDALRGMGVDCAQGYLFGRPSADWKTAEDVRRSLA